MAKPLIMRFDVDDKGSVKITKIKNSVDGLGDAEKRYNGGAKKTQNNLDALASKAIKLAGAYFGITQVYDKVIKTGIDYNRTMEQQVNGIQALIVATSSNISSTGRVLDITQKYNLALGEANTQMKELERINAATPHTLGQTAQIFKAMFANARSAGASMDQMTQITKLVSIAAGSAGIEFQGLLSTVDGLANGTYLANSEMGRFLTSIGLAPSKLKELAKEGKSIDYIIKKLKPFNREVDTFDVALSNLQNQWEQLAGKLTEPIFDSLKQAMKDLTSFLKNNRKEFIEFGEYAGAYLGKLYDGFMLLTETADLGATALYRLTESNLHFLIETVNITIAELKILANKASAAVGKEKLFSNESIIKNLTQANLSADKQTQNMLLLKNETKDVKEWFDKFNISIKDRINLDRLNTESTNDLANAGERLVSSTIKNNDATIKLNYSLKEMFNQYKKISESDDLSEQFDFGLQLDFNDQLDGQAKAIANVSNSFLDLIDVAKLYADESQKISDSGATQAEKNLAYQKLNIEMAQSQFTGFSNAAGAMANMYAEGSKQAESFRQVQSLLAIGGAAASIANSAVTTPYPANLIAIASTSAALIPMLAQAGIAFNVGGGGGASVSMDAFAAMPENTGTGTVLGDPTAVSESIANSLEHLEDNADPILKLTTQMRDSLSNIENTLGGVTAQIFKNHSNLFGTFVGGTHQSIFASEWATNPHASLTKMLPSQLQAPAGLATLPMMLHDAMYTKQISDFISSAIGKTTKSLESAGLAFNTQTVEDAMDDLAAQSFQIIKTNTSSLWGLIKTESHDTNFAALDAEIKSDFQGVIGNIFDTITTAATVFGEDVAEELLNEQISIGKITLSGKSGEELQEQFTNVFGAVGDTLAEVVDGLENFGLVGEGALETLTRVASTIESMTTGFDVEVLKAQGEDMQVLAMETEAYTKYVKELQETMNLSGITTDNYTESLQEALKSGELSEQSLAQWDTLGDYLIETEKLTKEYTQALQEEAEAKEEAQKAMQEALESFLSVQRDLYFDEMQTQLDLLTNVRNGIADANDAFEELKNTITTNGLTQSINDITGSLSSLGTLKSSIQGTIENLGGGGYSAANYQKYYGIAQEAQDAVTADPYSVDAIKAYQSAISDLQRYSVIQESDFDNKNSYEFAKARITQQFQSFGETASVTEALLTQQLDIQNAQAEELGIISGNTLNTYTKMVEGLQTEIIADGTIIQALQNDAFTLTIGQSAASLIQDIGDGFDSWDWNPEKLKHAVDINPFNWATEAVENFTDLGYNWTIDDVKSYAQMYFDWSVEDVQTYKELGYAWNVKDVTDYIGLNYDWDEESIKAYSEMGYDWETASLMSVLDDANYFKFDWNKDGLIDAVKTVNADGSSTLRYDWNNDGTVDLAVEFDRNGQVAKIATNTGSLLDETVTDVAKDASLVTLSNTITSLTNEIQKELEFQTASLGSTALKSGALGSTAQAQLAGLLGTSVGSEEYAAVIKGAQDVMSGSKLSDLTDTQKAGVSQLNKAGIFDGELSGRITTERGDIASTLNDTLKNYDSVLNWSGNWAGLLNFWSGSIGKNSDYDLTQDVEFFPSGSGSINVIGAGLYEDGVDGFQFKMHKGEGEEDFESYLSTVRENRDEIKERFDSLLSNGFSSGGFTGVGGVYDPAGIVHRGEVVFDQPAVHRYGVNALEAIRTGNPFDAMIKELQRLKNIEKRLEKIEATNQATAIYMQNEDERNKKADMKERMAIA